MTRFKCVTVVGQALVSAVFLSLTLLAPAVRAADPVTSDANIRVEFRIGTLEGETRTVRKSYSLIVASGSAGSNLLIGERIPFPTVESGLVSDGDEGASSRAIVYQNIGFATNVVAVILEDGKIRLQAEIEDSRVATDEEGGLPIVETRQVMINVVLTDGEALEVTRAEGLLDVPGFVEVEAEILR